ncbi:hypothetical protein LEP1GSC193_1714 [Leptospira alstonii serovar Pingchang str. 80-412]|uniref:Uncharacterized protein n=2 Tax=Leptospira alstonii TaxID=28452 RepID=M6D681_9LEPT|nr:hypothetical protein LEP1GSC194_4328 [Leptospira alstonii serovar Sichuan str. 79601]EQA78801.1 hypothetical protein LEP1GSC193_1714 [Leptospira alstonii serovar Pingchang str. 80-412]
MPIVFTSAIENVYRILNITIRFSASTLKDRYVMLRLKPEKA